MTWDEYYEKFYDWAESTRASRISSITEFGASDEICEIAQELFEDKLVQRLINRALSYGVKFKAEEIMELVLFMDKPTLSKMVETSADTLNKDQLEEIYMLIDDDVFERASKRAHIDIFSDDTEEVLDEEEYEPVEPPQKKIGFFTALFMGLGAASLMDKKTQHKHNGKCNGDCANCPPHYGYRYGRWYYGHHHVHGCEFGGHGGL